jgi:hypothetical protein
MSKEPAQFRNERIPPKILQLISFERNFPFRLGRISLNPDETAILKEIVKRTERPPEDFNMSRAVSFLAQSEKSSEVCGILGELVGNKNEATTSRMAAASNLSYIEGSEAQNVLIQNLGVDNSFVKQQVIKSLGIFGDEKALEELNRVLAPNLEFVSRHLMLAKALIIHRLGLTTKAPELGLRAERRPSQDDKLIKFSIQDLQREETNSDEKSLIGTRYGIRIGKRGFRIQAGKARWTLFVNSEMMGESGFNSLFERKWIAALLALWDTRRTNTLAVQFIVLTNPDNDPQKKSIDLTVVRTDGEVFCAERVTDVNSVLAFSIGKSRSVGEPVTF